MSVQQHARSPGIVEQLAELTRYRDRDLLDVTLANAFRDLMRPRSVAIYRKVGEAGDERWLTRARLLPGESMTIGDSLWTSLDALPKIEDFPARCDALQDTIVHCTAAGRYTTVFPLATDREVAGVLELETALPLDGEAQRVVCAILAVYRNFESLLDYSERDTLTGLLNRKTFDETFLKIIAATRNAAACSAVEDRRRSSAADPYWVGMIDVDHFKSVNDNFGHLIGDEVLLLQSRLMRSTFRFDDRLYRFGGEEFVVLMRCPSAPDATKVFERLRYNTQRYAFPQVGRVTISIGFAQVEATDSPSAALSRADQAVYYAKAHGRNQVCCYSDLVAAGKIAAVVQPVGEVDLF